MGYASTGATRGVRRVRSNRQLVKRYPLKILNGGDRLLRVVAFFMRRECDGNLDKHSFLEDLLLGQLVLCDRINRQRLFPVLSTTRPSHPNQAESCTVTIRPKVRE